MNKPNIPASEMIKCNSYARLLPSIWNVTESNRWIAPPPGIVHCCLDGIKEFFETHGNNGNDYVMISSSSDFGLYEQERAPVWYDFHRGAKLIPPNELQNSEGYFGINMAPRCDVTKCSPRDKYSIKCYSYTHSTFNEIPGNIKYWFLTNCMIEDPRCEPIPFGVFSDPVTVEKIANFQNVSDYNGPLIYVNFQDYTSERWDIKQWFNGDPLATVVFGANKSFDEFLAEMASHPLVAAPAGNGNDSYRVLEAIYLGCVPLVEKSIAMRTYDGLPVVYVSDYRRLRREDLISIVNQMSNASYNYEKATLSYWKNRIQQMEARHINKGKLNKLEDLIKF